MKLHNLDASCKAKWLNAEVNFITLYINLGFPAVPKLHMMQHIFTQFENDCAPRYAYCFAEESKNFKMAGFAKLCNNQASLPEQVMLMHELWASDGCPTVQKAREKRLRSSASTRAAARQRLATPQNVDLDLASADGDHVDLDIA